MPVLRLDVAIFMLDDGEPAHRNLPWRLPAFQEALTRRKAIRPSDPKVPPEGLYPARDEDLAPGLTREDADKIRLAHDHLCQLTTKTAKIAFLTIRDGEDEFRGREIFKQWFRRLWEGSDVNKAIDGIIAEAHCLPHELMDGLGTDKVS